MSALGQERTLAVHLAMSALPPKADIRFRARPRVGPKYILRVGGQSIFSTPVTLRARREPTCAKIEQNIRASQFMGRKSHKPPLTLVSEPASIAAEPPATLREAGRNLWQSVMHEYAIADAGGLALLEQACASADRAAEARGGHFHQIRPQGPSSATARGDGAGPGRPPIGASGTRR